MKADDGSHRPGPYGIDCPRCGAAPDVPCTNPLTGKAYRQEAPHLERVRAARELARGRR